MTPLLPTLRTERLLLRQPDLHCAPAYERFFMDGRASDGYGGAPLSAEGARARLARDSLAWSQQGFGVWALEWQGQTVGVCGFAQKSGWPRELTWWLLPAFRGRGFAFEASRAAIDHAHAGFGWARVETYMKDSNQAARALVARLGGVKIARPLFPDGLARDLFLLPPAPKPTENPRP